MNNHCCPLCYESARSIVENRFTLLYKCDNCQLLYKDISEYVNKETQLRVYNNHQNFIHDEKYRKYFSDYIDVALLPYIGSYIKGLDFGSGPAPVLSDVLNKDYRLDFKIFDKYYFNDSNVLKDNFDIITCTEVIEHLANPLKVFKLFYSLLNTGGILSIMTLFYQADTDYNDWFYIRDKTHICFYNSDVFKYIINEVGFEIIYNDNYRHITFRKK